MIKALLWSELRRQRISIYMIATTTVILWLLLFAGNTVANLNFWREIIRAFMLLLIPNIYGIVLGIDAFRERRQDNMPFLQGFPVGNTLLYWVKYSCSVGVMLTLMAINILLAFAWSPIASDRPWFRDNFAWILIGNILLLVLFVHAFCLLISLFGPRSRNNSIFFFVLPLLLLLAFPGNMLIEQCLPFRPRFDREASLIWRCLFSWLFVCWIFLIFLGWHLWCKRIAVGESPIKKALIDIVWLISISWLTFGGFYIYSWLKLESARKYAIAAGLVIDVAGLAPPRLDVPDQQTAMYWLTQSYKETVKLKVCFRNVLDITFTDKERCQLMAERQRTTEYMEKSASALTALQNIDKALEQKVLASRRHEWDNDRWDAYYGGKDFEIIKSTFYFLLDRAIVAALNHDAESFFTYQKKAEKLADFVLQVPFQKNKEMRIAFQLQIYRQAIMIGPDDTAAVSHYQAMLAELKKLKIKTNNGTSMAQIRIDQLLAPLAFRLLLLPYHRQCAAAAIREDIREEKLMPEIEKITLFGDARTKFPQHLIGHGYGGSSQSYMFFIQRSKANFIQLALALKIYRIEHGAFPDALSALVPELLPDIPVDRMTGKTVIYEKNQTALSSPFSIIRI